jgi:hypothetical protein
MKQDPKQRRLAILRSLFESQPASLAKTRLQQAIEDFESNALEVAPAKPKGSSWRPRSLRPRSPDES